MVILGLGSNVGDRLANLRKALQAIKKLPSVTVEKVSPVYWSNALLPENAPPEWDMPHLNLALRCQVTCTPNDLLDSLKNIEWSIGRKPEVRHWGPRILDIDILAWDDQIIKTEALTVPHENLQNRPFALWPLADLVPFWEFPLSGPNQGKTAAEMVEQWGSRFTGEAPLKTRQINQRVDTPELIGIINTTPDSFSDGGKYIFSEHALLHAYELVNDGAEILDIGAESTSPKAQAISEKEEWQRLEPFLKNLLSVKNNFFIKPKISVDTRHYATAKRALELGIDWINDVCGLDDPNMRQLIKDANADCVIMHHIKIPESRDHVIDRHQNPVQIVLDWGRQRLNELEKFGIKREKLIFDPGIGFGKLAEQSLALLQNVAVFKELNTRILIGHSRKTFLSLLSKQSFNERDVESVAMALTLMDKPIDYFRIHNAEMCSRAFKAKRALE